MEIATIGFTKSTAQRFFERLSAASLPTLVDVRLKRASQLAGFAKEPDISYFVRELAGMAYRAEPLLAPEPGELAAYRAGTTDWPSYAARYMRCLTEREVAASLDREMYQRGVVLLCSEAESARCHRRLAAEFLKEAWEDVVIRHL